MTTRTTVTTAPPTIQPPAIAYEANLKPHGIEVAGDRKWRDWRLRNRRPDLRQRNIPTFPDLSLLLARRDQAQLAAESLAAPVISGPFQKRTLSHLQDDKDYTVEQLQFRPLQATQDRVDRIWAATRPRHAQAQDELDRLPTFFFEELTSSLFARVWNFAADTFGKQADLDGPALYNLVRSRNWTRDYLQYLPADFVRCVSATARADPILRAGGAGQINDAATSYEWLFLDKESRISVCTAVIAKLLQENCFNSLLFGARKIEREALQKLDESQEDTADGTSLHYPLFVVLVC